MSLPPGDDRTAAPWLEVQTEQTAVLVDEDIYYASFCRAALAAWRFICRAGWQFDSLARSLAAPCTGRAADPPDRLVALPRVSV